MFGAGVVDDESSFKIVEGIQNEVDILYIVFNRGGIDVVDDSLNMDGRIDAFQFGSGSDGLGKVFSDVVFVVKRLTLEVGNFNEVPVDDSQESDTGAHQQFGGDASERAGTDQGDTCVADFSLPCCTDGRKSYLPGIPVVIFQSVSSLV